MQNLLSVNMFGGPILCMALRRQQLNGERSRAMSNRSIPHVRRR